MTINYILEKSKPKSLGRRICKGAAYVISGAALIYLLAPSTAEAKPKKVKQVVIKEVTVVEGKIQKPEVWYLLPRSNLKFGYLKKEKKLVPKIEEVIENNIFKVNPKY